MIENKYFMVVAFFIFSCTSTTNLDSDKTTAKTNFKSIIEASYSLKHSPEINRKTALKEKISRIAYYDNQGNVTEYKQFENGDTLYERTILIFNKEGKIIKGKILNANNELKKYWIKTMTKNERLEKLETYSSDKKLIQIQSSSFDNFGNTTELILKNANYDYTNKTIQILGQVGANLLNSTISYAAPVWGTTGINNQAGIQ